MPEIAKAYIQLVPTTKGIKNNIESELGGAGDAGGKKAGNRFAGAFKAVVAAAAMPIGSIDTRNYNFRQTVSLCYNQCRAYE